MRWLMLLSTNFFLSEAPTILTEVMEPDPIMQRDVFGPVLPVLTVNDLDDAIALINKQEKPLCVYAYSSNSKVPEINVKTLCIHFTSTVQPVCILNMCWTFWQVISRLMSETSSGSFCSNDSILQSLMVALPFGGVGKSVALKFLPNCGGI